MTTTYTVAAVAALPTPALLALYNEVTGKQTKKFASRADAERQTMRVLSSAGRIVDQGEAQEVAQGEPVVGSVKVTVNEGRLLTNIARNLMTGLNGAEPTCADEAQCWANQLNDGPFNIPDRSLPGLMASLVKKGLAITNGEGCELTEAGFAAYKALPSPLPSETQGAASRKSAAVAPIPKDERGALVASVIGAFRSHFAAGTTSVNLKELAPRIGISERVLRQAMDGAKRKGFVFPSLGQCCFGFVDARQEMKE